MAEGPEAKRARAEATRSGVAIGWKGWSRVKDVLGEEESQG